MTKINGFNEVLARAEIIEQKKAKEKDAKKAYIKELIAQGLDKTIAKALADAEFKYGLVKAL